MPGPWQEPPPEPKPGPRPDRRRRLALGLVLAALLGLGVWAFMLAGGRSNLSGEEWASVAYTLGFTALVSSTLFARRLRVGQAVRYALVWIAIVAALLLGFTFRDELGFVGRRMTAELAPSQPLATGPSEMAVMREEDGHFYIMGRLNDVPVRFMVDTGATDIALSPADARRVGVDLAGLAFDRRFETANGTGYGASFVADSLEVGPIRLADVPMTINQAPMRASLLGLSYLQQLDSYEVRGRRLYLRWKPSPAER